MNYRVIFINSNTDLQQTLAAHLNHSADNQYTINYCDPKQEDYNHHIASQRYNICFIDEQHLNTIPSGTLLNLTDTLPVILISHQKSKPETPLYFSDVILSETLSAEIVDRSVNRIFEQKNHKRQLKALALYDTLTQLPNRNHFQHRLTTIIAQHARKKSIFSLLLIDIDRFKSINDSFGYESGDHLLIQISKRLKKNLRNNDLAARLGNNEFAVILETDQPQLMAHRLMSALSELFQLGERDIPIHTSIGVSTFPQDGKSNSLLMKAADSALQHAKKKGGSNVHFYDASQQNLMLEKSWVEAEFYQALNNQQLFLEYQPLVDAHNLNCIKLEALCRWQHPQKGLIPPDVFIPLIEKTPMIIDLGRWVLETACRELALLQSQGQSLMIAVNISMMQICHSNFVDDVKQVLASTGADANNLELELTESALMLDPLQSISTLSTLRELGVSIAIDDFGTGHSSLSYLVDLPIDTLKIDRSFTYEFVHNKKRESVIKAIIALARSLELKTVAEGVEDRHTAEYLSLLGCDALQGYHISHPMRLEKIMDDFYERIAI